MIQRIKEEAYIFLLAIQFMTRLPVPVANIYTQKRVAAGARYYPAVGIIVGSIAAAVYWLALQLFTPVVAVLLSVAISALVTGAFHEDGLADTFDGIGGGRDRQRILEIMRDSRIGVFGLVALTMVLALKISALAGMQPQLAIIALVFTHALSRLSSVFVIASSSYVRIEGIGKPVAEGVSKPGLFVATSSGLICLALFYWLLSPSAAICVFVGLLVGHVLSRMLFEKRLGGYTGDCLGATQQITEVTIYLALLACQLL